MTPWKAFCSVMAGQQTAAPLSIIDHQNHSQNVTSAMTAGLKAGF